MTLSETVLAKVADWQPGEGRQTLAVTDEASGWTAAITTDRRDKVGCVLSEVALKAGTAAPTSLESWAKTIACRVTGLLEPLRIHEVDAARNEALLRSDGPSARGADVYYYEVLVEGTARATLRRFRASRQHTGSRKQVAFALTNEVLARLVEDLSGR
jgi:hypothetical protein